MTAPSRIPKTNLIDWKFTIAEQTFVARYGRLGNDFYKQYLPAGIPDEIHHPPKKIDRRLYDLAVVKKSIAGLEKS